MPRVLEPEVMEGEAEAAAYDELDRKWGDVLFQGFAESALRMGVREGRVLDVGTGSGRVAIRLARLNPAFAIEGVDLSESMLELARKNAEREGLTNLQFTSADAKRLPFPSESFDLVISHQLLHQLPDPLGALSEINRVTKREGAILVRDVRRLPEPLMTLVLPLWCLGYGPKLREQTAASFRAGLTLPEFRDLIDRSGIAGIHVRRFFVTHVGLERVARTFQCAPPCSRLPAALPVRLARWFYVSKPLGRAHLMSPPSETSQPASLRN